MLTRVGQYVMIIGMEWTLHEDSPRFTPLPDVLPKLRLMRSPRIEIVGYRGFDLEVQLVVDETPKIEIGSLKIVRTPQGQEITTENIRSIATQWIINRYLRQEVELSFDLEPDVKYSGMGLISAPEAARIKAQGPVAETIEWVAKLYRLADLVGDGPTKAVEETFEVSRSTAGNWIGRARSAGLIPSVGEAGQ